MEKKNNFPYISHRRNLQKTFIFMSFTKRFSYSFKAKTRTNIFNLKISITAIVEKQNNSCKWGDIIRENKY